MRRSKTKHEGPRAVTAPQEDTVKPGEASEHRTALMKGRAEILASLGINHEVLSKTEHVSEEDQAKVIHDQWVSLSLNRIEYQKLRLVNEALDRLAAGDYGVCPNCDEPIAPKRLRAIPWAKYCVTCQEQMGDVEDEGPAPSLSALYSFTRPEDSVPRPVPVER